METTVSLDNNCKEIHSHLFILHPLIIPKKTYFKLPPKINITSSNKMKHHFNLSNKIPVDNLSRSCSFSHHHTRNKAITTQRSFSFKINRHSQVCFISPYYPISSNLLIACWYENRHLVTRCALKTNVYILHMNSFPFSLMRQNETSHLLHLHLWIFSLKSNVHWSKVNTNWYSNKF
jgi:hypothetical protein